MKTRQLEDGNVYFFCPGCGCAHAIDPRRWTWNGEHASPTIAPSILARWTEPSGAKVCHSFVRDGQIQFLGDCTHELAGQTVELPDFDES